MKSDLIGRLSFGGRTFSILKLIFLCPLLLQCNLFSPQHPIPENLGLRIKNLREQYPPPNAFAPFGEQKAITKTDRGTYGGWNTSTMDSNEVIGYYSKLLKKDNWTFKQEESYKIQDFKKTRYVTFEKNGFHIVLEFADDEEIPKGKERTYGLNYGFSP